MADTVHIAIIRRIRVKTGETLDGIAKEHGMSWQQLAKFNWGTSTPKEIDGFLRSEVGCTKKTKDREELPVRRFGRSRPGLCAQEMDAGRAIHRPGAHHSRADVAAADHPTGGRCAGHPIPETGYRVVFED